MREGFCTCVAIQTPRGWEQIRPMHGPGLHLTAESVGLTEEKLLQLWIPGRAVSFELLKVQPPPRSTHPEDRLIRTGTLKLLPQLNQGLYNQAVEALTFPSIRRLYPNLQFDNGKGYVLAAPLAGSVGYIRCPTVLLYPDVFRVTIITPENLRATVKVTDAQLLRRFQNGEFRYGQESNNRLVRLSLAHPWHEFNPPRCYLMMSHLDI